MALTDGILAYWKLDDSGWSDATGNGYTLTDAGINAVPTGDGIINSGAVSNGSAQYLKNDSITVGSSYSVSLWVNVISDFGLDCVWNLGGHDGPAGVANSTYTYFFLGNVGGDKNLPSIGGFPAGWNHLCYVIDNDAQTQAFYLNGDYQNGNDLSGNFGGWNGFELGAFSARDLYSNSHLDEVGIWDRALTQTEITKLYNSGNGIQYPFVNFYYNNAQEDGDWGNVLNWWRDDAFTIQATELPTTDNPVNVYGVVSQNTQGNDQCYCSTANFWASNFGTGLTLQSSGIVNFYSGSVLSGNITDSVSMHDNSYIDIPAVIGGNATLRDSSLNTGTINGNATVYYDGGDGTYPIGGTVLGTITYIGFNFGQTCYFSQIENGLLSNPNNWFLDAERTIPAIFAPDNRNDVVFSGMETITGITGNENESITYKSISCDGVVFSGNVLFTIIATNGITAIGSFFWSVSIEANGSYRSCSLASSDYGSGIFTGNITLRNCLCISKHDADSPAIAGFVGNVNAYYPTLIVTGAVNGTLIRHGYGLRNTCVAHCHLDETSGTREVLDLYEEEGISEVVISGAGVFIANGTYKRDNPSQNLANTNQAAEIFYNGNEYQIDLGGGDYYYTTDFVDWFCTNSIYNPPPTTVSTISGFTVGSNTGLIGNAAKFNRNSLINDASELIAEFSISVWVKFLTVPTSTSDAIVGTGQTYGENFTIYGNNNRIRLYFDSSSSGDLQSDPISANTWHHCVLTVTLDAIKFYVNGEYLGEKTDVHLVNSGGFALSKFFGGNRLHDNALVDELNIFSVELNQTQVNSLYNNGLGLAYPFSIPGSKKIDLYKLLGIPFPAKDYKYSRLLNLPFFVKI